MIGAVDTVEEAQPCEMRAKDTKPSQLLAEVADVLEAVAEEDRQNMLDFVAYVERCAERQPLELSEEYFYPLARGFGRYNMEVLYPNFNRKERSVLCAMWVVFLRAYRIGISSSSTAFKYATVRDFVIKYWAEFQDVDDEELLRLHHTANWMALCFERISPTRSKGLLMQVIPKLLEGFEVKYVAGSNQSQYTANRIVIFEREGKVHTHS